MYSVFRVYFLVSDSSDGLLKHLKKQLKTVLNTFGQKNIAGNRVWANRYTADFSIGADLTVRRR